MALELAGSAIAAERLDQLLHGRAHAQNGHDEGQRHQEPAQRPLGRLRGKDSKFKL